jgi:hypothetical protein
MTQKFILILVLTLTMQVAFAQTSNLVLFSEKSEPFTLVLNGQQVNMAPALNVKVTNLATSRYHIRVLFNNPLMPEFQDFVAVNEGVEVTYALQSDNRGLTALRFVNEFSLYYRPIPPAGQQTIAFNGPLNFNPPQPGNPGGNVNIGINTGGQASDVMTGTTTTSTTVTTTTTIGDGAVDGDQDNALPERPDPLPGYNGPVGCDWPMDANEFAIAKESIESKSFSDSKMRVARQVAGSNCLLATQVKDLMGLFSFETDKLEFAKFAYDYTYDRGNFYKVNDAFSFESTIEDLENYLKGR